MPIDCPRCASPMAARTASPRPGEVQVTADVCALCHGIWLDGAELAAVSPALAGLPFRSDEIAEVATDSDITCPRCKGRVLAIDLLDVPIDLCGTCQGVWLDGGEYEALSRAADRGEGLAVPPGGPDRAAAARAQQGRTIHCAKCRAEARLDATYMTDVGLVCAACFVGGEEQAMRERASTGDTEFSRRVREPSPYRDEGPVTGNAVTGRAVAGVLFAVLDAALTSDRCSRCGCRHGSRCGHW